MDSFSKLIFSIVIGFIFFSILNFAFGEKGFYQRKAVVTNIEKLKENIAELETIKRNLDYTLLEIKNSDFYEIEARKLGMYENSDVLVQIDGLKKIKNNYQAGMAVGKHQKNELLTRNQIILFSIGFSFFIYLILLILKGNSEVYYGKSKSFKHSQS